MFVFLYPSPMSIKHLLLFLSLASAGVLGGALVGQYGFDLYPCDLCIYQRWPHGVVIAVGLLGALGLKDARQQSAALAVCCLSLLVGAGIAGYHSGVEWGWFAGPDACSAEAGDDLTIEELRAQIAGAPLVSCKQAMAYIFGLSMAVWNALISVGLVGMVIIIQIKPGSMATLRRENGSFNWSRMFLYVVLSPLIFAWAIIGTLLCVVFTPIILVYSIKYGDGHSYKQRLASNYINTFCSATDILLVW